MTPAVGPREDALDERLLRIDPRAGLFSDARVRDLPALLRPGDLLVVNDAATLPASLPAATPGGDSIEVRLAGLGEDGEWWAVLFGRGDWRWRTEDRPPPPRVASGDALAFGPDLAARVRRVARVSPRLVSLAFDREGSALWEALYRLGRPVQYSYLRAPLSLSQVQTAYAARPWAVEPPSAGRPLRARLLQDLADRGVRLAAVTHAAGLSATGDPALDRLLPLPERFEVPPETVAEMATAREAGGRVVAVGTTVVRCLEGAARLHRRPLTSGTGVTDVRLGPGARLRVVDGLLTGIHEPDTSHYDLLRAFVGEPLLAAASRHAEEEGYLIHEFGDSCLVLSD